MNCCIIVDNIEPVDQFVYLRVNLNLVGTKYSEIHRGIIPAKSGSHYPTFLNKKRLIEIQQSEIIQHNNKTYCNCETNN